MTAHLYSFPTLPSTLNPIEAQTVVANLVALGLWFEFSHNEDERPVIRVRSDDYPVLARIRDEITT